MADGLNLNARINIEVSAREAQALVGVLGNMDRAATGAARSIEGVERATARALSSQASSSQGNLSQIRQQERAYASYSQNIQVAARSTRELNATQAAATRAATARVQAEQTVIAEMSRSRYALYDVASTYGAVATAALGLAGVWTAAGISFEQDFASVIRTSGLQAKQDIDNLRESLIDLTVNMPVGFGDVAQVATIAGQLGVAASDVDTFTESITRFSATTNVSVETASKSLGRLAQLTNTPISQIENLSSSIYLTGINAVATEDAILSIASQIATAGDLAGFSADQIIALSSTFASLGIAPERARGSVQRIFGEITASVSEGGDALKAFSDVAGVSAQNFAETWKNDPQVAFSAFINGLDRAAKSGGDTNQMLKDLGIGAVRDIQALQALANNTEVYNAALSDSKSGFDSAAETQKGYAIQNDTVAAGLTQLVNTLKAVLATANNNAPLKAFVGALQQAAEVALSLARTKVGTFFAIAGVAILGVVGILATFRAGMALATASVYGLRVAQDSLTRDTGASRISLGVLTNELLRFSMGARGAQAAASGASTSMRTMGTSAGVAATGVAATGAASNAAAASMTRGAVAARVLTGALRTAAIGTGILAGFVAIGFAIEALSQEMASAETKAAKFFGSSAGLSDALLKDTQAGKDAAGAIGTLGKTVSVTSEQLNANGEALSDVLGRQVAMTDATDGTTTSMQNQNIVVGQNTREWVLNSLATGEAADSMAQWFADYGALANNVEGFDLGGLLDSAIDPDGNAVAQVDALISAQRDLAAARGAAIGLSQQQINQQALLGNAQDAELQGYFAQIEALNALKPALGAISTQVDVSAGQLEYLGALSEATGVDLTGLGDDATGLSEDLESTGTAAENAATSMFAIQGAAASVQESMFALGESVRENGSSFDAFSENGRANLDALQQTVSAMADAAGEDTGAFIGSLSNMLATLEAAGVDTSGELGFVQDQLLTLVNSQYGINLDTSVARQSIGGFIADATRALQAVALLEKRAFQTSTFGSGRPNAALGAGNVGADLAGASAAGQRQKAIAAQIESLKKLESSAGKAGQEGSKASKSFQDGYKKADNAIRKANDSAGKTGKAAKDGAKEAEQAIRTLVDYASDLSTVINRAFEIRFSVQDAVDDAANQFDAMRKNAASAADAIADANQKIRDIDASIAALKSNNKTLQYQLRVAIEYGDTLRANEIRAQLQKNNAELSGLGNDRTGAVVSLATAQDAATTSLTGNTAGARANRAAVQGLVQTYQKQIIALAQSGASTEEVARRTEELRQDFVRQLSQMGFNRAEVYRYEAAFDDLTVALNNVPRNITVRANADPAQQALNEFIERNRGRSVDLVANVSSPGSIGGGAYNASGINVGPGGINVGAAGINAGRIVGQTLSVSGAITGGNAGVIVGGRSSGGPIPEYHARGGVAGMKAQGTDTVPTMLTPGEYVTQKRAVDYYGLDYMNALNNMTLPRSLGASQSTSQGTSSKNAGPSLVELMPNQLQEIVRAVSTTVTLDSRRISESTNRQNANSTTRGTS